MTAWRGLSVAFGGFCGFVVELTVSRRMRSLTSFEGAAVGQGSTGRRVADVGQIDGVQAGCVVGEHDLVAGVSDFHLIRPPLAAAARSPDASEGCQVNTPRIQARSAAVSGCSRSACAASSRVLRVAGIQPPSIDGAAITKRVGRPARRQAATANWSANGLRRPGSVPSVRMSPPTSTRVRVSTSNSSRGECQLGGHADSAGRWVKEHEPSWQLGGEAGDR